MSFWRHGQIYPSDGLRLKTQGVAVSGSAPTLIVLMSLQPAIPWRVALPQSPPPLHRPVSIFHPPAETVNHHLTRGGGNFRPELTARGENASGSIVNVDKCGSRSTCCVAVPESDPLSCLS